MVLVCMMALSLVPVTTLTVSAAATGTTGLFNGNATYLLQERFNLPSTFSGDATRVFSGWDVDYRGGDVTLDGGAMLTDSNTFEKTSISHQLMKHTGGGLVMESVFTFATIVDEGFHYEMSGDGKVALRVETVRPTVGGTTCLFAVNGVNTSIVPEKDTEYHLRAEFTGSTVTVWINGEKVANNVAYLESTSSIDNIEISTSEAGIGKICIKNAYVYVNYTVNENFLGSKLSGWDVANGSIVEVPGAPYSADTTGFAINSTEVAEPDYSVNAPHVLVQAKTAADYTWTGNAGKVTVTDGASIGGRQNVVAAAGVGNDNSQTVGVIINGSNFAFAEDDIITYSYDIYATTATYARTWIRDMGDFSPYVTVEGSDHYANANRWTSITKTLTYEELCKGTTNVTTTGSTGWTTPGKFVVCIRPGAAQTIYLDNFVVKVEKAGSSYVSNVGTGARVEWTKPMNAWDNNVMYGTNVSGFEYVADPAGVKTSKVLKAIVGTAGAYGVVAVKVTDDFGTPVRSLKAGEVLDVSFDFRSSVAQGSTANGISLRIGDISFLNGSGAPTGTAYDMGSVQVAANTWTTIKASYNVTADMSLTEGQTWYIPIRVPTAGTIYIDNFKLAIRNPENAVLAPTWEAQKASDFTWKGQTTVTDVADPEGKRGTVAYASNLSDSNNYIVGFLLGNSFQFMPGDIISYSYDVYSSKAYGPAMEIRDQDGDWSARKQFPNVSITANTWTTISGSITYSDLVAGGAGFANADKYAIFIRPNTSAALYLDNFKVKVYNRDRHVLSMTDGARVVAGGMITKAADLDEKANIVTDGYTIGEKSNVVKVAGSGSKSYSNRAGIKFSDTTFAFMQGDVLEYSINIYPTVDYTLSGAVSETYQVQLRRNSSNTPMRNIAPAMTLKANEWNTITNRVSFDDLNANVNNNGSGNTWATPGQYSVYLGIPIEYYISDFTVKVIRPEYEFGEVSNASLEKRFNALSGSQTFEFDVLVPNGGANGLSAKFGGANFKIEGGKFYLGDTELYTPTTNVWYNIKIVNNGDTASAYVNGALKGSAAAAGSMTSISFENTSGKQILVDNIQVAPTVEASDYTDYPTLDDNDIATPSGELSIGIMSYPMWREGIHYGWDLITPYENQRTPYLGYYTGGSQEVADWNIKWWAEHGFDHVIYPFVRPDITEAGGQPSFSVRGEELHDGYMNAIYNSKVKFAIMLTNPLEEQFTNGQEWIDNVLPYITEAYFKHPNYKVVDNQLVVYNYAADKFVECLTEYDENGNETQNGLTEFGKILTALEQKAESLGYTGVMFVTDTSALETEELTTISNALKNKTQSFLKWKYTWKTDKAQNVIDGITREYLYNDDVVASVPMGFESTPWMPSDIGFIEPSGVESICSTIASKRTSSDPKLVAFTCWDEWGEGHFFSPSTKSGFDYLNAIRKTLTNKGAALESEDTPTVNATKRMGVLFPEGRQILKIREDKKQDIDVSVFKTSIGSITPSSSNFMTAAGTNKESSWWISDYTTYTVKSSQQATVVFKSPITDFSKVTAIKVNGYAENSATLTVNLGYDNGDINGDDRVDEWDTYFPSDSSFRFSCSGDGTTTAKDYILLPNNPRKLVDATNIKYVRFNPGAGTAAGSDFKINSITFYTDDVPGAKVYINDEMITTTTEPYEVGNTVMVPAYKMLIDAGAMVKWDKATKKLYATKDGITAIYHAEMRNVVDESENILGTAPDGAKAVYTDGNLFVSYDVLLKPFGYTAELTAGDIYFYSKEYKESYETDDYRWDFNKNGDTEGWTLSGGSKTPVTYLQAGSAITVKNGVAHYRASSTDTHMIIEGLSMPKTSAKDFAIRLDTDATQMLLRLYDAGTYNTAGGLVYVVNIPAVDGPQEIVLDLSALTPRDAGASFEKLADTITKVRLDAVYGKTGSNKIDYIQFGEPARFKFKAYAFGENIFTDYKAAYWNSSGTTNSSNWGSVNLTAEGDIMIKPSEGQNNGITGITWIKQGKEGVDDLAAHVQGKIVRVSFDYKGVGDITSFRFENRDTAGSPGRDGEEKTVDVTSDWQRFDFYINVDEVTDGRRWFGIRAIRKDSTGDDYLVVRDWQIRILDESTEVGYFTDSGVAIKAIDVLSENRSNDKVYVGAFDTVNKELNNFTSGNVPNDVTVNTNDTTKPETLTYYYMSPTDATTEIRAYWWDQLEPLCEPFVLQKAN